MNAVEDTTKLYQSLGLRTERQTEQSQTDESSADLMQEDFLTLMTTQLKNQDPMAPMENGEFLGQMAQFSSVKGIGDLNSSFSGLAESLYSNQSLMAASMVGKHALVQGNQGELTANGPLNGSVELPQSVGKLTVSISDASGQPVKRLDLGIQGEGMVDFSWDGTNDEGETMPPGVYQMKAEGLAGGTNTGFETFIEGTVKSLSLGAGGSKMAFDVSGIGEVSFADIRQVRQ
ncbi:flagellar hook assembly protein FlgD [Ectothiorhodospiraceae bacterium BW-2]|nr:flagellar hook assembly protein FlgD [Ectothiorhodospiraceae bacterium BW-2]